MELKIYWTIVIFIFGTVFGSFFNVVGYRLPLKLSLVKPGSFCPKCKHHLKWYELIPILSFIIQGGKCRSCGKKISAFYPIVEFTTGLMWALSFYLFGFSFEFVLALLTISFFVIVVVTDVNYLIIPDEVTIFFVVVLILSRFIFNGWMDALTYLGCGIIAFIIMYLIMMIGNFIFKKESLGGGDIKLMFYVGSSVGVGLSLFTIFLSSFIALPLSLIMYYKSKDSVIPYGPFILIACFIIIILGIDFNMILGLNY